MGDDKRASTVYDGIEALRPEDVADNVIYAVRKTLGQILLVLSYFTHSLTLTVNRLQDHRMCKLQILLCMQRISLGRTICLEWVLLLGPSDRPY